MRQSRGINYFRPGDIVDNPFFTPVAVTSVILSSLREAKSLLDAKEELAIPRSRLPLTIFVSALSFSHPKRQQFRVCETSPEDRTFDLGTRRVLHQIKGDLAAFSDHFDLTRREQESLALILQGKSNEAIEAELFISNKTVKNHVYDLCQKLGVKSRLELVNAVREFTAKNEPPAAR